MIFIFRRDLRIEDNRGLDRCRAAARAAGCDVIPIFIFNDAQAFSAKNKFFSPRAFDFMVGSLAELNAALPQLRCFRGPDLAVLGAVHDVVDTRGVYFNADHTPFARKRDAEISAWCAANGIICEQCTSEYSLVDPTAMEKPYQKFTPFYNRYIGTIDVGTTRTKRRNMTSDFRACPSMSNVVVRPADMLARRGGGGGRTRALDIVKKIRRGFFRHYDATRDELANWEGTTHLSAYLKFGCVSVREVFRAVEATHGRSHALIRQLLWRSFYDQLAYHFPKVLGGQVGAGKNASLRDAYDGVRWDPASSHGHRGRRKLKAWCDGTTGVPLVDAGMRQLKETGHMHNRVRMIVASFLVKSLHLDWRLGEQFFARNLIDYHPSANNGGWQWASGGGADSQQYDRAFSPWRQARLHDPHCEYIKRFVKELMAVPASAILSWDTSYSLYKNVDYPPPIVDHVAEVKKSKTAYKAALAANGKKRNGD